MSSRVLIGELRCKHMRWTQCHAKSWGDSHLEEAPDPYVRLWCSSAGVPAGFPEARRTKV
eukprot:3746428-Amphidinium_carterae.1